MDSFYLALKVALPIVAFMLLGKLIQKGGLVSGTTWDEMNGLVFKIFLPGMIFINIYRSNIKEELYIGFLVYVIIAVLIAFALATLITAWRVKDRTLAPVIIQGIYRSNFVLYGLQITESIFGRGNAGVAAVTASIIVPVYNILAVILFECYGSRNFNLKKIMIGILKNPLIIASLTGILFLSLKIPLPEVVESTVANVGTLATPLALIILGGTFTLSGLRKYITYVTVSSFARLILIPAVFILIGIVMGYRQKELVTVMALFASPTAVGSFSMASQMGGDGELAGQIVAVTSALSVVTIFGWTLFLSIGQWIT